MKRKDTEQRDSQLSKAGLVVDELKALKLHRSLAHNKQALQDIFRESSDFVMREFQLKGGPEAMFVYIDGLVDMDSLNEAMASLTVGEGPEQSRFIGKRLPVSQLTEADNYGEMLIRVLSGNVALLIEQEEQALVLGLTGGEHRSITEPANETVIRGSKEGFTENLRVNTALIRRRIKSTRLQMKQMTIGRETNTSIVVCYIAGLASSDLIEEVTERIRKIQIDGVLESGYIEELIQDNGYSPFPQMLYSERPDTIASSLLEGRVAILVEGTPNVLIAPVTFWQMLQVSEDYYERFMIGSLLRLLRLVFLFISLTGPAFYIALTTFHQEMIPTMLLLSIAASREPVPFQAIIEALIMELAFEALREASLRLPTKIGQATSIIGTLVIGQAAVQAGIVSTTMVIVVSITGIASFTTPKVNTAISIRMLRFPMMIMSSLFGVLGIAIGLTLIVGHMAKLRSFGVPFLSPLGPIHLSDLKDTFIRKPWWSMRRRPGSLKVSDYNRIGAQVIGDIAEEKGQPGDRISHEENR